MKSADPSKVHKRILLATAIMQFCYVAMKLVSLITNYHSERANALAKL